MDCLRLKYTLSVLFIFLYCISFAQNNDSVKVAKKFNYSFANLKVDLGAYQINDPYLKSFYQVRNALQWNVGFETGNTSNDFIFDVQYGQFRLNTSIETPVLDSTGVANGDTVNNEFRTRRSKLSMGFIRKEKIKNRSYFTVKSSILLNNYSESSRKIDLTDFGFLVGMGYLFEGKDIDYFVDLNYEYAKFTPEESPIDWSGINLVMGISFRIYTSEISVIAVE